MCAFLVVNYWFNVTVKLELQSFLQPNIPSTRSQNWKGEIPEDIYGHTHEGNLNAFLIWRRRRAITVTSPETGLRVRM